ncbi:MAG: DUF4185 domain-containing protein [Bacteroidales bacterium]|nr:DUF4185 domain-containing protein [Bacteroidales bacterium]
MKAKTLLIIAAIAIPMVSCEEKPETPIGPDYQELTFSVNAASVQGLNLGFTRGDAVSIFDGKANQKFTATSATEIKGTANANADAFLALYPYSADYKRTSGKVSVTLPSAQAPEAGKVAANANFQVAYAASTKDALNFAFMPALLKFNVASTGRKVVSVTISADGNEALTGTCSLELSETPKCEIVGEGMNKVTVTNAEISGAFYAAVLPGTVSGYTVAFTASDDSHAEVKVKGSELKCGAVTDLGTFDSFEWVEPVNPNPTNVVGAVIMKASFETADFNMIGDGGFEDFPRDGWKWDDPNNVNATLIDGHNSPKALRMERTSAVNMTNLCQGVVYRACAAERDAWWVVEFDARVSAQSNVDFYSGFSFNDEFGCWFREVSGGAKTAPENVVENGRWFFDDEQWHHYVFEDFNFPSQAWGFVHLGMWGDPATRPHWSEYDNVVVYPKELDIKGISTAPKTATVLGKITNATFDQVDGLGKVVAWMDTDNKVKLAFSDVVINGTKVSSAIAETQSTDPTSIQINKFYKSEGTFAQIIPLQEGEVSIVPDDVFIHNGKTYLHYYGITAEDIDPNITFDWVADRTGFAVSEDNGKTWTVAPKTWGASRWANNGDGKFSNAAFVNHGGYTYMIGSHAGRDNWLWGKSYAARISDGKDITDPNAYEYWKNQNPAGPGWADGSELGENSIRFVDHIIMGDRGTYDLIWNPKFEVYQLFYRADAAQGIVYRDSKGPDADGKWYWSGAKLLTKDEDTGVLGSISVLKVEDDGSVVFVGSIL